MSTSNYDGPRGGDYVRYVDTLLRASPLYRSAAYGMNGGGRSDFTDAASTPGAQPASALERVRERAQAAVQQAQREAQPATAKPASPGQPRKVRRPRQELESEQAARRAAQQLAKDKPASAASWFRITPGRIVFLVFLAIISMAVPGMGALVLLFGIINAVRKGIRSATQS